MNKKDSNSSGNNLRKDLLIAGGAWAALSFANFIEQEAEYYSGLEGALISILAFSIYIGVLVVVLPVAFRGLPEALERKRMNKHKSSGGSFSNEAMAYFEMHPYESYYTDSNGSSWDNLYYD